MSVSRRCRRLAMLPGALFVLSLLLPAHGLGGYGYVPGFDMLRHWLHRLLRFSAQELPDALWYLVAFSGLANLLLTAGIALLYNGKGRLSIVLGIGGVLLTIAPPLAFGAEMVAAPCFLAWQGSMVMLVVAGALTLCGQDGQVRRPNKSSADARRKRLLDTVGRPLQLWSRDRQYNLEFSTTTACVRDGDRSAVRFHDPPHDR
jgi:hypothetical protein